MDQKKYIIRGGIEGRERLRILARLLQPTTLSLFERAGIRQGMACLDLGCGGGDVSFALAKRVGTAGRVVGIDVDETKIALARQEAKEKEISQVEFFASDIFGLERKQEFDAVYARFLLTHLHDPKAAIRVMQEQLVPGGMVMIEDIDFTGHFIYPENASFRRYVQLYTEGVILKGGDPNIAPKLPVLLKDAGWERVGINVIQPAGITGEVKRMAAITMENIADSLFSAGLASREEIDSIIQDLYHIAEDEHTVMSLPRIVQTWAYRPE